MAIKNIIIFLTILAFHLIFNQEIQINNFEEVIIQKGTYRFSYSSRETSGNNYFYFKFPSNKNINLLIIDENDKTTKIDIDSNYWCYYKIPSNKIQTYIFKIDNNGDTTKMQFIDSSQEINTNLNQFINLDFNTKSFEDEPQPLIFNIEKIQEDIYYYFRKNQNVEYNYEKFFLYYCIKNEKEECNYSGFNQLKFEKGKKYKIKFNPLYLQYSNPIYIFKSFSIIQEINFGLTEYIGVGSIRYFLVNIISDQDFYIYSSDTFTIFYIYSSDKMTLPDYIIDDRFSLSYDPKKVYELRDNHDCLLIRLKSNSKTMIYLFNDLIKIYNNLVYGIDKGKNVCISINNYSYNNDFSFIVSSNNNIAVLDELIDINNLQNLIFFGKGEVKKYIYINTNNEKSLIKFSNYEKSYDSDKNLKIMFLTNNDINNNYLNNFGPDSIYERSIFIPLSLRYIFWNKYFLGLNEKYYLYIRKFYGISNVYKYSLELNGFTDIAQFYNPFDNYDNSNKFKLINNSELFIISGYQMFSFIYNYNSLFDFYLQKVDDLENIEINKNMFIFNNLVKILNEKKNYFLNFTVDHLIKLDYKFLDAVVTFTDNNGKKYTLNKEKRIINNLSGNNIKVYSTKNALLYFYKKIPNYTGEGVIVFDKTQKGKNMKFNIKNINDNKLNIIIVKDFGFPGYYPMLKSNYWEVIESKDNNIATIYIENYYDKANYTIDEEDSFIIYLFDAFNNNIPSFNSKNYQIENPNYIDSLATPGNKYNFEVIDPNKKGSFLLNVLSISKIKYQFLKCNSKKIQFKIENSKGYFDYYDTYPYSGTITDNTVLDFNLNYNDTLIYTFNSDNEFLFSYGVYYDYESLNKNDFQIFSIFEKNNNIITIKFVIPYNSLNKIYLIVAKKDENNNVNSFSNICYVAKLMIQNSDSILVKTIYKEKESYHSKKDYIITDLDISKLNPNENDNYIITIIDESLLSLSTIEYINPKQFIVEKPNSIEIKADETVNFDLTNRKLFKFEFINAKNISQALYFFSKSRCDFHIILYGPDNDDSQIQEFDKNEEMKFILTKSGTYYLELDGEDCYSFSFIENTFTIFISGTVIKSIDLSQRIYSYNLNVKTQSKPNPSMVKVNNLTDNRYVYFFFNSIYYSQSINQFEICNDNNNECVSNKNIYKFLKNNNYTININFVESYNEYYFPSFIFFPIFKDTMEEIEEGYYVLSEPKIYTINLENKKKLIVTHEEENNILFYSTSQNKINMDDLYNLTYDKISYYETFSNYWYKYVVIVVPSLNTNPTRLIIANKQLTISESGEYTIPAGEQYIIDYQIDNIFYNNLYDNDDESEEEEETEIVKPLTFYNRLLTFSSSNKNLRTINSYEINGFQNIIIQNYFYYPIFVGKSIEDINITIKEYNPRYAFFGIATIEDFKFLFDYFKSDLQGFDLTFNFNNLRLRVNSDFSPVNEFFNFYLYNMSNIYIYLKKYYGNVDIYEYDPDLINGNDFSILTKPGPIYNKGKSLLNRMINLKGDKLIMGYIGPNSYFDIYLELENNSTSIDITPLMEETYQNTAKYLKKDIEYILNFTLNHIIQLDEGFDAEVTIYNNKGDEYKLTPDKPVLKILLGNNFKIRAKNNALVYFNGLALIQKVKIDPEQKGKNLEIKVNKITSYIIDFGFEGSTPTDIFTFSYNSFNNGGNIYVENIYDKLQVKLKKDEFLYFYYISELIFPKIIYSENLNHKNNEYTFNYVPKNSKDKTLIISNGYKEKIRYQVNFCESAHEVKMYYQDSESSSETLFIFNNEKTVIDKAIIKRAHKLRFDSQKNFIFSYSFIDYADIEINKYKEWKKEREVLENLNIEEIIKKYPDNNNSDIFTIKFKPNYKNSSTRYIIVIASNTEDNSIENFNNPCYVTKIANEKPKLSKTINVVDIGENDSIEIEADINDILGRTENYIVNIISQELRFEKN